MVVGPRQPFVAGDDDEARLPFVGRDTGALIEKAVVDLRGVVEDIGDGGLDLAEIGLHIGELPA